MSMDPAANDPHEQYVRAASRSLGLTIPDENLAGVVGFFRLAESMATLLNSFVLDDEEDPAPVYWPSRVPE